MGRRKRPDYCPFRSLAESRQHCFGPTRRGQFAPRRVRIFTLFSALAQLEREQIAERTSTAMLRHQAKGRRMRRADRCPFGWRPDPADDSLLVEDADEQKVIARIREERRHGRGLREIARRLDLAAIGCRGGRWSHTTVRSVLLRLLQLT